MTQFFRFFPHYSLFRRFVNQINPPKKQKQKQNTKRPPTSHKKTKLKFCFWSFRRDVIICITTLGWESLPWRYLCDKIFFHSPQTAFINFQGFFIHEVSNREIPIGFTSESKHTKRGKKYLNASQILAMASPPPHKTKNKTKMSLAIYNVASKIKYDFFLPNLILRQHFLKVRSILFFRFINPLQVI